MAWGVLPTGFKRKRLADINTDIQNDLRSNLGTGLNFRATSLFSNFIGTFSGQAAEWWESLEGVYHANRKSSATGTNLDDVMALVNVSRSGAQKSTARVALYGVQGTAVPIGTRISVIGSPDSIFETIQPAILGEAGVNSQQKIVASADPASGTFKIKYGGETTGPIDYNVTPADLQTILNSMINLSGIDVHPSSSIFPIGFRIAFNGDDGSAAQPLLEIVDNALKDVSSNPVALDVEELNAGVFQGVVDCMCTVTGAVVAPAFSLTQIETPVSGLDRVRNFTDAIVGRDVEKDNDLRARSSVAQRDSGKGSVPAIRTKLLDVPGVVQAIVFTNRTAVVDANGLPPKSVRAYVQGGEDQAIWDKLWDVVGGGIESDGTEVGSVVDSDGVTQVVKFSRPVQVPIYVRVRITKTAAFPADGTIKVQEAIAAYVNSLQIGESVITYPRLISTMNGIPGITKIELGVDTGAIPALGVGAGGIPVGVNELAHVNLPYSDILVEYLP